MSQKLLYQNFFNYSTYIRNVKNLLKHGEQIYFKRIFSSLKKTHPSADRNSEPIRQAFTTEVDGSAEKLSLLEISSGSGQHAGYLAPFFPNIAFQPTEFDTSHFPSIKAYAKDCVTKNIKEPLYVDISENYEDWAEAKALECGSFDYMFNSNMMHISPWACSIGLFKAAGILLKPKGKLFTYGPYAMDGVLSPESNVQFDLSLKARNPEWGVRDIADLKRLAEENHISLKRIEDMPSNNKFLTWVKDI